MAFGFKPIGMTSSDEVTPINEYQIATSASAIYKGDPVKQVTDGTIEVAAAGDVIIGIFAGCTYYNAKGEFVNSPNYDAPTGESDIRALVYDDPKTRFEVLANDDVTQANVGALYDFAYTAGSAVNGLSAVTLDISSLATSGKAFRITGLTNRVGDNARVVQGIFVEHALLGVTSGVGGV